MTATTTTTRPADASATVMTDSDVLGTYVDHRDAERVVTRLADDGFPVENLRIIVSEMHEVERVGTRVTWARATGYGAVTGLWAGLLVGFMLTLSVPLFLFGTVVTSMVIFGLGGAVVGLATGVVSENRGGVAADARVIASRFSILVRASHAARARELLAA